MKLHCNQSWWYPETIAAHVAAASAIPGASCCKDLCSRECCGSVGDLCCEMNKRFRDGKLCSFSSRLSAVTLPALLECWDFISNMFEDQPPSVIRNATVTPGIYIIWGCKTAASKIICSVFGHASVVVRRQLGVITRRFSKHGLERCFSNFQFWQRIWCRYPQQERVQRQDDDNSWMTPPNSLILNQPPVVTTPLKWKHRYNDSCYTSLENG